MQRYPVRNDHRGNLTPENLERILRAHFETVGGSGEERTASFGAIARLSVRPAGRELALEVTMNPKVPGDVAAETIGRYNAFLQEATGYSAKERAKRLKKSATAADPEG